MQPRIRSFDDRDAEAVVDLSLRAWAPVFASLERVLGSDIIERLHPDWREDQRRAVEDDGEDLDMRLVSALAGE
jgi:hypothetical protein